MEDLSNKPLNELMTEATQMDQKIDLLIMKYNLYMKEIKRRFPMLEQEEVFREKNKENMDHGKVY